MLFIYVICCHLYCQSIKHKNNINIFNGNFYYENVENNIRSTCTKFIILRQKKWVHIKSKKGFAIFYNILNYKGNTSHVFISICLFRYILYRIMYSNYIVCFRWMDRQIDMTKVLVWATTLAKLESLCLSLCDFGQIN